MKAESLLVAVGLLGVLFASEACASPETPADPPAGDFVEASAGTHDAIGVTRWSTSTPGTQIDGYDDDGRVAVSLRHSEKIEGDATIHSITLGEREHVASIQFAVTPGSEGVEMFEYLGSVASEGFAFVPVLDLMKKDLEKLGASRLTAQALGSGTLLPTDTTVQLVCDGQPPTVVNVADVCMRVPTTGALMDAWGASCTGQAKTKDGKGCADSCTCVKNSPPFKEDGQHCVYELPGGGVPYPSSDKDANWEGKQCGEITIQCPKLRKQCVRGGTQPEPRGPFGLPW